MQVNWLAGIGLTTAEVCTLFAKYPPFVGTDLDTMKDAVNLLKEEISLSPRDVVKVRNAVGNDSWIFYFIDINRTGVAVFLSNWDVLPPIIMPKVGVCCWGRPKKRWVSLELC